MVKRQWETHGGYRSFKCTLACSSKKQIGHCFQARQASPESAQNFNTTSRRRSRLKDKVSFVSAGISKQSAQNRILASCPVKKSRISTHHSHSPGTPCSGKANWLSGRGLSAPEFPSPGGKETPLGTASRSILVPDLGSAHPILNAGIAVLRYR